MTHASLFSGIGGFELAAKWAGIKNMFTCEIDPFCKTILEYYYPKLKHYGDIKRTRFITWQNNIDILTASFPCQPFSTAGKREGVEDDRYLWEETVRVVHEVSPTWFIGENVTGLLSMVQPEKVIEVEGCPTLFEENNEEIETVESEFIIETICQDLEQIGYSVQPFVIPACAVGAPHKRERIWIVAHTDKSGSESMCERKESSSELGFITNSKGTRPKGECINRQEYGQSVRPYSQNKLIRPANTNKVGCGEDKKDIQSGQPAQKIPDWEEFPTQPPIYSRNDGIQSELLRCRLREDSFGILSEEEIDEIFSKSYRRLGTESIKAGGNAIVPQVAYQLFKGIVEVENKLNKKP